MALIYYQITSYTAYIFILLNMILLNVYGQYFSFLLWAIYTVGTRAAQMTHIPSWLLLKSQNGNLTKSKLKYMGAPSYFNKNVETDNFPNLLYFKYDLLRRADHTNVRVDVVNVPSSVQTSSLRSPLSSNLQAVRSPSCWAPVIRDLRWEFRPSDFLTLRLISSSMNHTEARWP